MKLFLDYINKIKFYIILHLFPVMLAEIIFFLYQLPLEPMVYVTVFWLLTGICACLNGFYRYRKKVEQLELIAAAPDINLSQMDSPVGQDERFQQEIMQQLNQMRIDVENASQKASEDMTDYYTMWHIRSKRRFLHCDFYFRRVLRKIKRNFRNFLKLSSMWRWFLVI